jgi:hypothetical protein
MTISKIEFTAVYIANSKAANPNLTHDDVEELKSKIDRRWHLIEPRLAMKHAMRFESALGRDVSDDEMKQIAGFAAFLNIDTFDVCDIISDFEAGIWNTPQPDEYYTEQEYKEALFRHRFLTLAMLLDEMKVARFLDSARKYEHARRNWAQIAA